MFCDHKSNNPRRKGEGLVGSSLSNGESHRPVIFDEQDRHLPEPTEGYSVCLSKGVTMQDMERSFKSTGVEARKSSVGNILLADSGFSLGAMAAAAYETSSRADGIYGFIS